MANRFNLAGLAALRGGARRAWMRVLPAHGLGGVPLNALIRGVLARQQVRALGQENIVRDPDTRHTMGSVSLVAGGLPGYTGGVLPIERVIDLIRQSVGAEVIDMAIFNQDMEFTVDERPLDIPIVSPVQPINGRIRLVAANWVAWRAQINGGNYAQANVAGMAPALTVPAPAPDELHPWALGGLLNIDLTNGQVIAALAREIPAYMGQMLIIISLMSAGGGTRRLDILNMMALGVTVLTSGGNITPAKIRKIIQNVMKETLVDNIDFTQEQVQKGWDIISVHWQPHHLASDDFMQMFQELQHALNPVSLRLSLLCQQTENKMLTGIIQVTKAIAGFQDFPWDQLNAQIIRICGRDELAVVRNYLNYVDPQQGPPVVGAAAPPAQARAGGHWTGWAFALRQEAQGNFTIPNFCNLLYASIQLHILVGGNLSLTQYKGLTNQTISGINLINTWIQNYIQARQVAGQANYPQNIVAPTAALLDILGHNL